MNPRPEVSALEALLGDSLVQLAMRADHIEPRVLKAQLADVGRRIAARRSPRRSASIASSSRRDAGAHCRLAACW
jgi:hypothetical protein